MKIPNEALEAARNILYSRWHHLWGTIRKWDPTEKQDACNDLEREFTQRDAKIEAAALERAADECDGAQRDKWEAGLSSEETLKWNKWVTELGDAIRNLGPDPTFLERERLNARIEENDQTPHYSECVTLLATGVEPYPPCNCWVGARRAEIKKLRETLEEKAK